MLTIRTAVLIVVICLGFNSAAEAADAPVTECDYLAAHPDDFQRVQGVTGVLELSRIEVTAALAACRESATRFPEAPRFKYQLARALIAGTRDNENMDCKGALELLEDAVGQGHAEAAVQIGRCYSVGSGVPKDSQKGVEWTRKAHELGSPTAKALLAMAIAEGAYTYKKDVALAVSILDELAEAGNTTALFRMFQQYRDGQWVNKDIKRSFAYLLKAAERGHRTAQYLTWSFYTKGELREGISAERANEYLALSAEAGHRNATKALQKSEAASPPGPKARLPHGKPVN